jgi:hypothetical protein
MRGLMWSGAVDYGPMSRTSSPSRKNEAAYLRRVLADTAAPPAHPLALLKGAADGLGMLKGERHIVSLLVPLSRHSRLDNLS